MGRLAEVADGVLVGTSELYMTTTTVVTGRDGGCLVIDPAITAADLAQLAAELTETGLRPAAGWSTHPHWDHVLWSRDLGEVPRFATARAAATATAERAGLVSAAEEAAPGHDLDLLGRLTALPPQADRIAWVGPEAQVVIHDAHAPGHGAVFLPATGTLIAGDMCSDIEIPLLDLAAPDPLGGYRAGLELLANVPGVRMVIPGHGRPGAVAEFRRRLDADRRYLDALEHGETFRDPRLAQAQDWLLAEHDAQARRVRRRRG